MDSETAAQLAQSGAPEEDENNKIYYGFGVFMGLPLADLKSMKEDYIRRQGEPTTNKNSTSNNTNNNNNDPNESSRSSGSAMDRSGSGGPPASFSRRNRVGHVASPSDSVSSHGSSSYSMRRDNHNNGLSSRRNGAYPSEFEEQNLQQQQQQQDEDDMDDDEDMYGNQPSNSHSLSFILR